MYNRLLIFFFFFQLKAILTVLKLEFLSAIHLTYRMVVGVLSILIMSVDFVPI